MDRNKEKSHRKKKKEIGREKAIQTKKSSKDTDEEATNHEERDNRGRKIM